MRIIKKVKLKMLMALAMFMFFVGGSKVFSQQTASIYQIQALFLYNFTKHIKWQNGPNDVFTIGIYKSSEAYKAISENLGNKVVWGKNIKVIEISNPAEVANCHIAYIPSQSDHKQSADLVQKLNLSNTLLVTEDDFAERGAAISFILQGKKMRFKINKNKIEESGLKVSSSLISIGIPV